MKVQTQEFRPVVISLETIQEYTAFVEMVKVVSANVGSSDPAGELAEIFANELGISSN